MRSTRHCSGLRHHARSSLFSPSSWDRLANESLSGTFSAPELSTRPDQLTPPEAWTRCASSTAEMFESAAGRAATASGVTTSTAAVTSAISQRLVTPANVGCHLSGPWAYLLATDLDPTGHQRGVQP